MASAKYTLFYKQQFTSNTGLKLAEDQAKAEQHHVAKLLLFENCSPSSSTLPSKNNRTFSKRCSKNKCVCFKEIIWPVIMKMKMKLENRSHRYDISRPRPRHVHSRSTKYKKCLGMMMLIDIKQHLSNIWGSIHENVKHHWDWAELIKKRVFWYLRFIFKWRWQFPKTLKVKFLRSVQSLVVRRMIAQRIHLKRSIASFYQLCSKINED